MSLILGVGGGHCPSPCPAGEVRGTLGIGEVGQGSRRHVLSCLHWCFSVSWLWMAVIRHVAHSWTLPWNPALAVWSLAAKRFWPPYIEKYDAFHQLRNCLSYVTCFCILFALLHLVCSVNATFTPTERCIIHYFSLTGVQEKHNLVCAVLHCTQIVDSKSLQTDLQPSLVPLSLGEVTVSLEMVVHVNLVESSSNELSSQRFHCYSNPP